MNIPKNPSNFDLFVRVRGEADARPDPAGQAAWAYDMEVAAGIAVAGTPFEQRHDGLFMPTVALALWGERPARGVPSPDNIRATGIAHTETSGMHIIGLLPQETAAEELDAIAQQYSKLKSGNITHTVRGSEALFYLTSGLYTYSDGYRAHAGAVLAHAINTTVVYAQQELGEYRRGFNN